MHERHSMQSRRACLVILVEIPSDLCTSTSARPFIVCICNSVSDWYASPGCGRVAEGSSVHWKPPSPLSHSIMKCAARTNAVTYTCKNEEIMGTRCVNEITIASDSLHSSLNLCPWGQNSRLVVRAQMRNECIHDGIVKAKHGDCLNHRQFHASNQQAYFKDPAFI